MGRGRAALSLRAAPGDDHLLLEDVAEISGGAGRHATGEQSRDQVYRLTQAMMVSTPVGGFNGSAVPGFLVCCLSFHTLLFPEVAMKTQMDQERYPLASA